MIKLQSLVNNLQFDKLFKIINIYHKNIGTDKYMVSTILNYMYHLF